MNRDWDRKDVLLAQLGLCVGLLATAEKMSDAELCKACRESAQSSRRAFAAARSGQTIGQVMDDVVDRNLRPR